MKNRLLYALMTVVLSVSITLPALAAPSASPSPSAKTDTEETSPSPSAKSDKESPSPSPKKASPSPSAKANEDDADKDKKSSASPSPTAKKEDTSSNKADNSKEDQEDERQDPSVFPTVHAEAALLLDMNTGAVVYAKNEKQKMYPASTTKILTAILALEKGNLSDIVVATEEAISPITKEHSQMGILVGEELTVEQLLYALLVSSANDAANVLAVHIGGSISGFVDMMNARARELGAMDSNFVNPHGFHDANHYTTASDLATLARYAMKNEKFREIVATKTYDMPPTNKYEKNRKLSSTNHLVSKYRNTSLFYKYATGIKTGHTDESGDCLVASATKGDINLLSVLLGCENEDNKEKAYSFTDTTALFEHVFNNFKYHKIASTTEVVADSNVYEAKKRIRVTLGPAQNVEMLLPNDTDPNEIKAETTLNEKIAAPIKQGEVLGHIQYTLNGKTLISTDLIALNEVKRDEIIHVINSILRVLLNPFVLIPVIGIILLLIYININRRKRRKQRRSRLTYTTRQDRQSTNSHYQRRRK